MLIVCSLLLNFATKSYNNMKANALSVANYFIDLAQKDNKLIHLLGLVKRVYIAHGLALAYRHKGLLDPRFDKVEAWKYGPVIPSVYHSFKQNKNNAITEKVSNLIWNDNGEVEWVTPQLTDKEDKEIVEAVWKRYINYTDSELVTLLHRKGTPWYICYVEGVNVPIPDEVTASYYELLMQKIHERYEQKLS